MANQEYAVVKGPMMCGEYKRILRTFTHIESAIAYAESLGSGAKVVTGHECHAGCEVGTDLLEVLARV